jgi:probable phosphoglycerate mutase
MNGCYPANRTLTRNPGHTYRSTGTSRVIRTDDNVSVEPSMSSPRVMLVRHGETGWTRSGQHTSRTNIPLTDIGRRQALALAPLLGRVGVAFALTSPRVRAVETARLAGCPDAEVTDDAREWDYGEFEGRTTADIRESFPGWSLWRDGAPGGETLAAVAARADRLIERLRQSPGDGVVFSHGHFLRVLAARWVGLAPTVGEVLALAPATISRLGWEREQPVIALWNEGIEP